MLDKKELLDIMNNLKDEHNVPSMQVGIIKDEEVIFSHAVGYRDYENKIDADTKTVYAIGSATKAFVAESIAMLVDEKKLQWDTPIKKYIPEFKMYDNYVSENLTVRDILCHRCGLPRHDLTWYLNQDMFSLEDMIHNLRYLEPNEPFRYKMQYQNHMFMLAGYLIERVTGKKWDRFVYERILSPLQMGDTNCSVEDSKRLDNKALPYRFDGSIKEIPFRNIDVIGSAGAINSNAENMLKWVQLNLAKGQWEGKTIISKENIKECHTPQMVNLEAPLNRTVFEEIKLCSYGLGWFIESYKGHEVIHHGGNIDGFAAMVSFIPEINAGFVILTNGDGNKTSSILQNIIYDILLDCDRTDWNSRYIAMAEKQKREMDDEINKIYSSAPKNTKPSLPLGDYTGNYDNTAYGKISISADEGKLILKSSSASYSLEHLCFDSFMLPLGVQSMSVPLKFNIDVMGKITGVDIDFEPSINEMIRFVKVS